jgi:hypothetical protein
MSPLQCVHVRQLHRTPEENWWSSMIRLLRVLALTALITDVLVIIVAKTFLDPIALPADTSISRLVRGVWPFLVATAFFLNPTVAVLGLITARSRVQLGWVISLLALLLLGVYAVPLIGAIAPDLQRDVLLHDSWVILIANEVFAMPAVLAVLLYSFISPGASRPTSTPTT